MKKSNKGFTLIELLAVIVVLAVIALIATPIVLRLVDEARVGAAESSATAYVKAVENSILQSMVKETNATFCSSYSATENKETPAIEAKTLTSDEATGCTTSLEVDVKGNTPDAVTVNVANGSVTTATFEFGDYTINYANGQSKRS